LLVLHGQGHGPCRIARETGLSRKQVARLLESEGITREPSRPASARLPEILELCRQGCGFATIGRRLGFSRNAVRRAFRRQEHQA
jgi:DNA-binding NarL/FixJ family response regulator